jgi:hypothetical protein
MANPYTFLWLSEDGDVAGIDSANCFSDADAILAAHALFRQDDVSRRWCNCPRIETYLGSRFVNQVARTAA